MATFSYLARERNGREVASVATAGDTRSLAALLRAQGLVPVTITEVPPDIASPGVRRRRSSGRPKLEDVAPFARQLSVMLRAGVSLDVTLADLATQIDKASFAAVVNDLRDRVRGGERLAGAMKAHPQAFSRLICALVLAGEESGNLPQILDDLADYLDSQIALRREIKTALSYPIFLMAFFLMVFLFLFLFLLPKFKGIYSGLGKDLPLLTVWALNLSVWVRHWFVVIILLGVGAVFAVRKCRRLPAIQRLVDRLLTRLPGIGTTILRIQLVRFIETLATLQRSGVAILTSLDIAKDAAGNSVIEEALSQARIGITHGSFLSREMAKHEVFPQMLIRIVAVGEESGNAPQLLRQIASFYRDEVDADVSRATRLLEPVLIVLMAAIVAVAVLAVYLPIFALASALG